jgi:hypothetical protein
MAEKSPVVPIAVGAVGLLILYLVAKSKTAALPAERQSVAVTSSPQGSASGILTPVTSLGSAIGGFITGALNGSEAFPALSPGVGSSPISTATASIATSEISSAETETPAEQQSLTDQTFDTNYGTLSTLTCPSIGISMDDTLGDAPDADIDDEEILG